jgi:hypothetical protein
VHGIANMEVESGQLLAHFKEKVQENQQLKEKLIWMSEQLTIAQEKAQFSEAEFAFQRSELESEIESLQKIDQKSRDFFFRQFRDKDNAIREAEARFRQQLESVIQERKDYVQKLQVQVARLRSNLVELQSQNEIVREDNIRLRQANAELADTLSDQKEISDTRISLLEKLVESEQTKAGSLSSAVRLHVQQLEKESIEAQNNLRIANATIDDQRIQHSIAGDREATLNEQLKELTQVHKSLQDQFAEEYQKESQLETLNSQLQNKIDVMETDLKTTRRLMAQIEDNTKYAKSVFYCSPLQRTRIDIFRVLQKCYDELVKAILEIDVPSSKPSRFRSAILTVLLVTRWRKNCEGPAAICDHCGGLVPFESSAKLSPIRLVLRIKNELMGSRASAMVCQERLTQAESIIAGLSETSKIESTTKEAAELKLASERRCNRSLHKQIGSFIRFHNPVVSPGTESSDVSPCAGTMRLRRSSESDRSQEH